MFFKIKCKVTNWPASDFCVQLSNLPSSSCFDCLNRSVNEINSRSVSVIRLSFVNKNVNKPRRGLGPLEWLSLHTSGTGGGAQIHGAAVICKYEGTLRGRINFDTLIKMLGEGERRRHVCASYLIKRDHCLLGARWRFNLTRFRNGRKREKRLCRAERHPRCVFSWQIDEKRSFISSGWI